MNDPLKSNLLDILYELQAINMSLVLGGGYGLYLKQIHLQETGKQTLLSADFWPAPRATQDLDFLLTTEIITSDHAMKQLRSVLDRLGYLPLEKFKCAHFTKSLPQGGFLKIDLLVGPIPDRLHHLVKIKEMRVRSRPRSKDEPPVRLHAYLTPEAIELGQWLDELVVEGTRTDGQPYKSKIFLPNPFTYLVMKLFAFRDRKDDPNKNLARHHALDLYRITAMLLESEYAMLEKCIAKHFADPIVRDAKRIVADYFSSIDSLGALRLSEYRRQFPSLDIPRFIPEIVSIFR